MRKFACILVASLISIYLSAQIKKAPEVKDGDGPWPQLIIRGVTLINSTGAPPVGPVDIVVEKKPRRTNCQCWQSWLADK